MIVTQNKYNKKNYNFKKYIKVENEHQTTTVTHNTALNLL